MGPRRHAADVTDANVVLGRIDPEKPNGRHRDQLDVDAARSAMGKLGTKLGLGLGTDGGSDLRGRQSTHGWPHPSVVDRTRARSARIHPRCLRRRRSRAWRALVRKSASARCWSHFTPACCAPWAASSANVRYDYSRTVERAIDDIEPVAFRRRSCASSARKGEAQIKASQTTIDRIASATGSTCPISAKSIRCASGRTRLAAARYAEAFKEAYAAEFGNTLGNIPVVVVNVRTTVEGVRPAAPTKTARSRATGPRRNREGAATFISGSWIDTPIYARGDLNPVMIQAGRPSSSRPNHDGRAAGHEDPR